INFEDDYFQKIINPDFEKIDSPFQQTSSLKPYVSNMIFEKIIIDLEDEVVNLLEKEKANLETIESLKSKGFESSETVNSESENQSENDYHVDKKQCGNMESSKVIAPGMFKLNVSQCVSPISMSKSSCESNNVEIKLKRKRRERKSSKLNVKQVDNDVSRANNDFIHFSDLDTFSSVRRPKNNGVIWKKKESSNTSNVDSEKIDSPFQQTSSLKPYVPNVIFEKIIIDLEDEVVNLLEKEKANSETIESLKSKSFESSKFVVSESENQNENDCHKTKRRIQRPKNSGVIWKKKWSSNTSNVGLSAVRVLNLIKNVKRYSRKDLLACNNSHLGETSSASVCNDAMNVSCNSRMNDLLDDNNFFIFDDVNVRISPVSKMPFRKKPCDSMHVRSKSNSNKSLPRTIVQICLWIIDLGCSKHMMGNHALSMNFVEKFPGTVRFGNNDFAVIAGYGDVVIGSMTIKKVYYFEGLGHNLFSVRQFCDKGLDVAFRKSTCFFRNENGVDLLTGDRSSNLYTIALNKVASNSSTCLLAKASSSQSWLWHQRLSHLNFATINNLVKNNLVQGLHKMKFEKDHLCFVCEQGKIHRKHHKSKTDFASNKPLYLLHMDLCGPMRVQSINGKRYVLVVVDDYSRYTWVFFLHSKDEASEVIISFIKKTQVSLQLQVQRV
nr:retrovirus-related Pol polyprotein from transposon TNT 1-94 [Tanacetum cinerariifolium]